MWCICNTSDYSLTILQEEHSTLQCKVSILETDNASLQEQFSDIEDSKDKLQACLQHTEKLEAERDDYQRRFEDSNEWIMHHLYTQVCVFHCNAFSCLAINE